MRILIDTSVLVRLSHLDSPNASSAALAVKRITLSGLEGCVVPQVLYEYWVVATRPAERNGLGFSASRIENDLLQFVEQYTLLRDERKVFGHWLDLVSEYQVVGKNAHDARLVATMQRHGIPTILTLHARDFRRYSGITVYTPENLPEDLDSLDGPSE